MVAINGSCGAGSFGLPVLRVVGSSTVEPVVCSVGPVVVNTHWINRRLWCAGDLCPGCEVTSVRTVVYFVGLVQTTPRELPCLLELTAGELSRLEGIRLMEGVSTWSGGRLRLTRRGPKSPIRADWLGGECEVPASLVPTRRALAAAAVLAGLPTPGPEESLTEFVERTQNARRILLERAIRETC